MDWLPQDDLPSLIQHWKRRRVLYASDALSIQVSNGTTVIAPPTPAGSPPEILLQATIVVLEGRVDDGELIRAVATPWFEIIRQLEQDPEFLYRMDWRKLEELVAGAYRESGCPEVILTPRSNDKASGYIERSGRKNVRRS